MKNYLIKFKGTVIVTSSLKAHHHNLRIIAAYQHAQKHGYEKAAKKYDYSSVEAMKKVARKKLNLYTPAPKKNEITDKVLEKAIKLRLGLSIREIAKKLNVSESMLGKKINHAKTNPNNTTLFQKWLCGKI